MLAIEGSALVTVGTEHQLAAGRLLLVPRGRSRAIVAAPAACVTSRSIGAGAAASGLSHRRWLAVSHAEHVIAMALPFVWLGLLVGISAIETPLKFRAPGITTPARPRDRPARLPRAQPRRARPRRRAGDRITQRARDWPLALALRDHGAPADPGLLLRRGSMPGWCASSPARRCRRRRLHIAYIALEGVKLVLLPVLGAALACAGSRDEARRAAAHPPGARERGRRSLGARAGRCDGAPRERRATHAREARRRERGRRRAAAGAGPRPAAPPLPRRRAREEPFKRLVPLLLELLDAGDGSPEAAYAAGRAHGECGCPRPASAHESVVRVAGHARLRAGRASVGPSRPRHVSTSPAARSPMR